MSEAYIEYVGSDKDPKALLADSPNKPRKKNIEDDPRQILAGMTKKQEKEDGLAVETFQWDVFRFFRIRRLLGFR